MSHPQVFADPSSDLDVWNESFGDVFYGESPVDPPALVYRPLAIQDGTEYRPLVAAYGTDDYRPVYVAVEDYRPRVSAASADYRPRTLTPDDYRPRNPGGENH